MSVEYGMDLFEYDSVTIVNCLIFVTRSPLTCGSRPESARRAEKEVQYWQKLTF